MAKLGDASAWQCPHALDEPSSNPQAYIGDEEEQEREKQVLLSLMIRAHAQYKRWESSDGGDDDGGSHS